MPPFVLHWRSGATSWGQPAKTAGTRSGVWKPFTNQGEITVAFILALFTKNVCFHNNILQKKFCSPKNVLYLLKQSWNYRWVYPSVFHKKTFVSQKQCFTKNVFFYKNTFVSPKNMYYSKSWNKHRVYPGFLTRKRLFHKKCFTKIDKFCFTKTFLFHKKIFHNKCSFHKNTFVSP